MHISTIIIPILQIWTVTFTDIRKLDQNHEDSHKELGLEARCVCKIATPLKSDYYTAAACMVSLARHLQRPGANSDVQSDFLVVRGSWREAQLQTE